MLASAVRQSNDRGGVAQPRYQRPQCCDRLETIKAVSRFLSAFDTGLKPGVNEMTHSRF